MGEIRRFEMRSFMRWKFLLVVGLIIIAYIPAFAWMIDRWSVKDSYYSHGFLVPFISAYIVWLRRSDLALLNIKPVPQGWIIFGGGILLYLLSAVWRIYFSSGFSLLFVLAGLILLFWGRQHFKLLLFPLEFLAFMIPLPLVVVAGISFRLKVIASQISTALVNILGMPAVREGSVIKTLHAYVVVEDPCSGMRSLIALIALGALMAYFSPMTRAKKMILFLSSIPIAILTNVIRIVVVTMASEFYGSPFATGMFHDVMGILVFVFAFLGLMFVAGMIE